jgi:hypothetical protein
LQHTLPVIGGYVSAGGYYSLQDKLFQSSDGSGTQRAGFMGGFTSPDIPINAPWLQKINFTADVQTGKNAFGAAGGGVYFYFSDRVDVLTGPVYFFDPGGQPGGRQWFWTVQLDVDMPLTSTPSAAPTPAPPKAASAPADGITTAAATAPADGKASAAAPADAKASAAAPADAKASEAEASKKP